MDPTPGDISRMVRGLYTSGGLLSRYKQYLRPYICPFHTIVGIIPENAQVLDIGCGDGILINVWAKMERIASGFGFDASQQSINMALRARDNLRHPERVSFQRLSAEGDWPDRQFDVVTMVDVMHHIDPEFQRHTFHAAVKLLKKGGLFIYKDMCTRPVWMAWANRLHDLVLARDWIHYVPLEHIGQWARDLKLEQLETRRIDMLWYGHELCVFRKHTG